MSKAVLVFDMPEKCCGCPFEKGNVCGYWCSRHENLIDTAGYEKERHPDCPLRELPERADRRKAKTEIVGNWVDGWNACLDAMEGGSNNE